MSKRKGLTMLKKSSTILSTAKETEWCYVDATNTFELKCQNKIFEISDDVKEYRIDKKPSTHQDYTNESEMDFVLAVVTHENDLKFYNLRYEEISKKFITEK